MSEFVNMRMTLWLYWQWLAGDLRIYGQAPWWLAILFISPLDVDLTEHLDGRSGHSSGQR